MRRSVLICEDAMPFNARQLATDFLNSAYNAGGSLTATFDIGDWPDEMIRETVDYILADREQFKLRLKGIRTDTAGCAKFGISMDTANSGRYKGVPVVMTEMAAFDANCLISRPAGTSRRPTRCRSSVTIP
jgi:hypothetical protein